ncbi:uncharacterized protein LOC131931998 [Physella acuta]|uniref:uncharacterized protein LOC131931998 n=1 Tax=Physella acuta TaxID=109671 RepID=UPI0027DC2662|nr:uncharacterized protein LOC131931998 [Physella acuta]
MAGVKSNGLTHIFVELAGLEELSLPLSRSARLKYTCISVSKKYVALGSNTGGVYIFSRDTLKYLQVVFGDTDANSVTCVSLAPSDQHVGFALSTGHVAVFELNIEKRAKPERIRHTQDHLGHHIKTITWDSISSKMFVGDETGKLSIVFIPSAKGKTLFAGPSEIIAYLNASVYQMEWWKDKLLVSTTSHTHFFDTIKHNYSTIGTKKRDGEFGSCFFLEPNSQCPVVYCARPGSRMWEVDFEGKVLNTHQFKQLLAIPPLPVVKLSSDKFELAVSEKNPAQSVNFYKMFRVGQFIVTWSSKGIYLFDPINVKVVVWTQNIKDIKDVCVLNNDIYLFLESSTIHKLTLLPIYQLFSILCMRKKWSLMSSLMLSSDQINIRPAVMKRVNKDLLQTLLSGLKEEGKDELLEKVRASMEDLSESSIDSFCASDDFMDSAEVMGHTYLPSGMVVVSEGVQIRESRASEKTESGTRYGDDARPGGSFRGDSADIETDGEASTRFDERVNEIKDEKSDDKFNQSDDLKEEDKIGVQAELEEVKVTGHMTDDSHVTSNEEMSESALDDNISESLDVHEQNKKVQVENSENSVENNSESSLVKKAVGDDALKKLYVNNGIVQPQTEFVDSEENVYNKLNQDFNVVDSDKVTESLLVSNQSIVSQLSVVSDSGMAVQEVTFDVVRGQEKPAFTSREHATHIEVKVDAHREDTGCEAVERMRQADLSTTEQDLNSDCGSAETSQSEFNVTNSSDISSDPMSNTSGNVIPDGAETEGLFDVTVDNEAVATSTENTSKPQPYQVNAGYDANVSEAKYLVKATQNVKPNEEKTMHRFSKNDNAQDLVIAQPLKPRKKKKKKKALGTDTIARSMSLDIYYNKSKNESTRSASFGDDPEDTLYDRVEMDFDAVSISTISSIDEEDDSLSSTSEVFNDGAGKKSFEFSVSPPVRSSGSPPVREKQMSRKASIESRPDSIPPLIDRLAAARVVYSNDDMMVGNKESPPSQSPLTGSGEHFVGSPKTSLSSFTDSFSQLKSQTKSFIKTIKEKNLKIAKSPSSPMLSSLTVQQKNVREEADLKVQDSDNSRLPSTEPSQDISKDLKDEPAPSIDTSALCSTALEIQKSLAEPSTLLNSKLVHQLLTKWAVELNTTMLQYHQLLKQHKDKNSNKIKNGGDVDKGFNSEKLEQLVNESDLNKSTSILQNEKTFPSNSDELTSNIESSLSLDNSSNKTSPELSPSQLPPQYWTDVFHLTDPFQLKYEHLELIQTLTTMCFVYKATGNVLNVFGLSNEDHKTNLVKNLIPPAMFQNSASFLTHIPCLKLISSINEPVIPDITENNQTNLILTSLKSTESDVLDKHQDTVKNSDFSSTYNSNDNGSVNSNVQAHVIEDENGNQQSLDSDITKNKFLFNEETFSTDLSLALFLRVYFFALNCEKVKQELDHQGSKLFLTWSSFMHCSRDRGKGDIVSSILADKQVNSAIDYLRSGILPHQSSLWGHIYQLFEQVPSKTSEFAGEISKQITATDILHLCVLCAKPVSVCLPKYVKQVIVDLPTVQRPTAFSALCTNRDVRYLLLEALLPALTKELPLDGTKSVASHVVSILPFDWLNILLSLVDVDEEREEIVTLCLSHGYWPVCVKLLTKTDQWQRLLQLIVDIGDLKLLKGKHGEDAYIPRNLEEWRYLLNYFHERQSSFTGEVPTQMDIPCTTEHSTHAAPPCDPDVPQVKSVHNQNKWATDSSTKEVQEIQDRRIYAEIQYESFKTKLNIKRDSYQDEALSWSSLGYLLLEHIGGAATINLLMEYLHNLLVAKNSLSTEFLNACFIDFSIKVEQDLVTHEMLEKMSAYMWAKMPGFIPPSVYHAITLERNLKEKGEGEGVTLQGVFGQVKSLNTEDMLSENLGGHWGQEVDISSPCLGCNIPLKYVMSLSSQGVVVFPCKHAFHKCCAQSQSCPLLH